MLKLENLSTGYYKKKVIDDVSIGLKENNIYLLIGPNGAGKSTLLKTIAGFLLPWDGKIIFKGIDISLFPPYKRAMAGIGYYFQGGEVFKDLTVKENIEISGFLLERKDFEKEKEKIYDIFPDIKKIENRRAGLLSGGEKVQLALSMVFIRRPVLVLIDEPSAGLGPGIVKNVMESIKKLKEIYNSTILMVEQNIIEGLKISDFVFSMASGKIIDYEVPAVNYDVVKLEKLYFGM